MKVHLKESAQTFGCTQCDEKFKRKDFMVKYQNTVHTAHPLLFIGSGVLERQRERERETERDRDTKRKRVRKAKRDGETKKKREKKRDKESQREREREGQRDRDKVHKIKRKKKSLNGYIKIGIFMVP